MTLPPFTKTYRTKRVLDFPGFPLPQGRVCAVIGANGSGKSTLAKIVTGVLPPDSGRSLRSKEFTIGYMPQHSYPFQMTVLNNVLLNSNKKSAQQRQKAAELLDCMGIGRLANQKAHRLSGGETARMALVRLLIRDYDLLVLDEPTAAMDIQSTILAEQLIAGYQARTGCSILWITHSQKQAQRVAHTILFFYQGQLIESGPAAQLLTAPQQPELKQFLEFYSI